MKYIYIIFYFYFLSSSTSVSNEDKKTCLRVFSADLGAPLLCAPGHVQEGNACSDAERAIDIMFACQVVDVQRFATSRNRNILK